MHPISSADRSTTFDPSKSPRPVALPTPDKLKAYTKGLSQALQEVKDANKKIQQTIKPLEEATKSRQKRELEISHEPNKIDRKVLVREQKIFDEVVIRYSTIIDENQKKIASSKQLLTEVKASLKLAEKNSPEIKKINSLVKKLSEEVHKQDVEFFKKLETRLTKITGNNLFNSIFRVKKVSRDDVPNLRALARDLRIVQEHPDAALFRNRIEKMEGQIGRALLIGYGYQTEKDIDKFLKLNGNSIGTIIHLDDAAIMIRFIQAKYPQKDVRGLQKIIQVESAERLIDALLTTERIKDPERAAGEGMIRYLRQVSPKDPFFEKAKELKMRLHEKLHPDYFREVHDFLKDQDAKLLADYHPKLAEHREMLQEYYKQPGKEKEAARLLTVMLTAENRNFLSDADKAFRNYQQMTPEGFAGVRASAERLRQNLLYYSEGFPITAEANKAHTLRNKFEKLLRDK